MVIIGELGRNLLFCTEKNVIEYNLESNSNRSVNLPSYKITPNKELSKLNSLDISNDQQYLVLGLENKNVIVLNRQLEIINEFTVKRCPSKVIFTKTNNIVVADKTGEVYLYKFDDPQNTPPELLLGHPSIILDVILSDCGKYIITCDRDEKIRISSFPNAYNIVSYCLGHSEFVTKIQICGEILLSASGDGTVRLWNFHGEQLGIINTNSFIKKDFDRIVQDFSNEMAINKINIDVLPVTDMQIYRRETELLLAVSIFKSKGIQIYKINLNTFDVVLLNTINLDEEKFSFYLGKSLFVLNNSSLYQYNVTDFQFETLQEFYGRYKQQLQICDNDNSITALYKRKFDNVQEYMEKKKLRLERKL